MTRFKRDNNDNNKDYGNRNYVDRNDGSNRNDDNNESHEDDNTAVYNTDKNSEDDSELNCDNTNINVYEVNNYIAGDIHMCEAEKKEMEVDFTISHLARWCKTLNVPTTHVNMLKSICIVLYSTCTIL